MVPTHNPREDRLSRVFAALREQTLPSHHWETILVDNASRAILSESEAIPHRDGVRFVREERLGLTFARLRGFAEATGELIVTVDDDNLLEPDYLEQALNIAQRHPSLGVFGGKCVPDFETEPPAWLKDGQKSLGLRDRGDQEEFFPTTAHARDLRRGDPSSQRGNDRSVPCLTEFPDCAPIGAGMVLRREVAAAYATRISELTKHSRGQELITDRKGEGLSSGGDNDICLTALKEGWQVGYFPQLQLTHLIAEERMTLDYQRRMARDSMKSFILVLDQHGIRPWPAMPKWTLPLRVANDWCRVKPWLGIEQSLTFWGNVGMYEGRAALPHVGKG